MNSEEMPVSFQKSPPFTIGIIGAGGLGIPALWALLSYYNSTTKLPPLSIKVFDFDEIELSNLNRQVLFRTQDIGKPKAETLCERIKDLVKIDSDFIQIEAIATRLDNENLSSHLKEIDCIIDATDSVSFKLSLNDYCCQNQIALATGGIAGFNGQIILIDKKLSPEGCCLRCIFPELSETDYQNEVATCQHSGILGPVAGYLGSILGTQAFTLFTNRLNNKALVKNFIRFDAKQLNKISSFVSNEDSCKCSATSERKLAMTIKSTLPIKESLPQGTSKQISITQNSLDLRNTRCPKTFLFTKMALERLPAGEPLTVLLATQKEADEVRKTSKESGYQIIGATEGDSFKLTLVIGEKL
jgi:molybdopterin/thiamine biosynthesis adenylyltransferase/TusA-related sulfurtransferase